MKWLVTGGCGFIGTRLIEAILKNNGNYVRVLDNLSTGTREQLGLITSFEEIELSELSENPGQVQLLVGDILDKDLTEAVASSIDTIVHLAANTGVGPSVEDPRNDCMHNVIGLLNMLESARINKVKRFVFASSGAPIGNTDPPIHEELPAHPVSPYGASKLAGEGYCSAYKHSYDLDTVALRFSNVYGPGSTYKNSVVAKFLREAIQGNALEIYGDGNQTRDFLYINDLINAILRAATVADIGGETFQIATNRETSIEELAELLSEILNQLNVAKPRVVNGSPRIGDIKRNYSDIRKASRLLNWQPQTNLAEGLKFTAEYFLNN